MGSGDALDNAIGVAPDVGAVIGELWSAAYPELKRLARSRLRRSGPLSMLDTTGLVNEAYTRLAGLGHIRVEHRGQFFAYSARTMRSIIVDLVRESQSLRHGGGALRVTLDTAIFNEAAVEDDLRRIDDPLRVDKALASLAEVELRLAQVVEMRYFGGFTEAEIGETLGITERTVRRDWSRARVLLRAMLEA